MNKIIYAVRSVSLDKIKIGESNVHSLFNRIRSHQTGSADELELIGVHYGEYNTDKKIHPLLNSSHSHLEWFDCTEQVGRFIESNFLVFPKPLSLLTNISWSTSKAISVETVAISEYVKGNIKNHEFDKWLESFDLPQYVKGRLSQNVQR